MTSATERLATVVPGRRAGAGTTLRLWSAFIAPLLGMLAITAIWQGMALRLQSPLVPTVDHIGRELVRIARSGALVPQLAATLTRVALGFVVAFVFAVATGTAMGRSLWLRRFLEPAVLIGLTVPGLVWALLCVIWFGVSLANPIVAVALSAAPAIALTVAGAVRSVDADLLEMVHVFRLRPFVRLTRLWLPALAPALLSGSRFGLSLAWKVIVLVEIFGMSSGVGYQLNSAFASQNVAGVIAWTIAFGAVMAFLEYGVFQTLERRLNRWRRTTHV